MCRAMAADPENQEALPEKHLKRQLAAVVRKIQWSYAIFWSAPSRTPGVLQWSEGFYNGDIKTRKTTQPAEFKADQMGLQRSEQLRELFESLAAGDTNQQTKRPTSLSPEDLTDTEWYYLVCMSFTFTSGQCLPGKALANNQHIWLTNAHSADSKIFSRSLLAKSASIQTVLCFPFMGGVLELGSTEFVLEDPALIHQVTTSFWDLQDSVCSEQSMPSSSLREKDEDILCPNLDHHIVNSIVLENRNLMADCQTPAESGPTAYPYPSLSYATNMQMEQIQDKFEDHYANICEELNVGSPDVSSNDWCPNQNTEDSLKTEGLKGTSQDHSRQLIDDDLSNGIHGSLNSSNCMSMSFVNPLKVLSSPKGDRIKNNRLDSLQEGHCHKFISLDFEGDDAHYTDTLAAILRNSKQLDAMPCFPVGSHESSFTVWRRGSSTSRALISTSQKLLKKVLMDPVQRLSGHQLKAQEENVLPDKVCKPEGDDACASHVLSERRRREKLNEKFLVLRSLVPSISKVDKASILGDTIDYLKELEKRIEELESCRGLVELEVRGRRRYLDVAERTSDNYGSKEIINGRKSSATKRKASHIDEEEAEYHQISAKDSPVDVNVTVIEKELLIEIQCPWRECLLLEIVESISNFHLEPLSVQSSTFDGILTLTIKSKFRNSVVASPGMIKRTLQRVVGKC